MAANKYGNKRTVVDNITFDSKAEARRYSELKLMERAGEIRGLTVHPAWELTCPAWPPDPMITAVVCRYVGDFAYIDARTERITVEDVKSPPTKTPLYKLKRKWLLLEYGIEIQEIEA